MKKILMIIGGFVVGAIVLGIVIITIISLASKKMVCKSNEGSITLMYNSKTLTGYKSNGLTYDFDGQQKYAEQVGIDAYLAEFDTWFRSNTSGTCSK